MIEKPPKHLRPTTKAWFSSVLAEYSLEPHHVRLLTLAAESWDRCCESREALAEHGLTFIDRTDRHARDLKPPSNRKAASRLHGCAASWIWM